MVTSDGKKKTRGPYRRAVEPPLDSGDCNGAQFVLVASGPSHRRLSSPLPFALCAFDALSRPRFLALLQVFIFPLHALLVEIFALRLSRESGFPPYLRLVRAAQPHPTLNRFPCCSAVPSCKLPLMVPALLFSLVKW